MRIGIDLGGTTVKAALCGEDGTLLCKQSAPTPTGDAAGLCAVMKQLALTLCGEGGAAPDAITSIGIGVPGSFDKATCTLKFGTNLGMNNVCFADAFRPEFGCAVQLDNDANCAALGEATAGSAKGARNMVMVTLGTGVGSGIIVNGKIVTGVNCAGGECGHMVIVVDGEPCSCGRKGCWEAYASATALIRQTRKAMEENPDSIMHEVARQEGKVSGRTAFDAMRKGDIAAIKVVDNYIKYVACGLINIVNALQPEIICVGGGICNEGETLMKPLRRFVQAERYSIHSKIQTHIMKAELGNDAGIIGASILASAK